MLQLLSGQDRTACERRIGVCVMDDLLEHSSAGSAKYMAQILPVLLQAAQDKACGLYSLPTSPFQLYHSAVGSCCKCHLSHCSASRQTSALAVSKPVCPDAAAATIEENNFL